MRVSTAQAPPPSTPSGDRRTSVLLYEVRIPGGDLQAVWPVEAVARTNACELSRQADVQAVLVAEHVVGAPDGWTPIDVYVNGRRHPVPYPFRGSAVNMLRTTVLRALYEAGGELWDSELVRRVNAPPGDIYRELDSMRADGVLVTRYENPDWSWSTRRRFIRLDERGVHQAEALASEGSTDQGGQP